MSSLICSHGTMSQASRCCTTGVVSTGASSLILVLFLWLDPGHHDRATLGRVVLIFCTSLAAAIQRLHDRGPGRTLHHATRSRVSLDHLASDHLSTTLTSTDSGTRISS